MNKCFVSGSSSEENDKNYLMNVFDASRGKQNDKNITFNWFSKITADTNFVFETPRNGFQTPKKPYQQSIFRLQF